MTFEELFILNITKEPSVLDRTILQVQQSTQLQPVDSSAIYNVGYESTLRVLTIDFQDGSAYQYYNVGPDIAQNLVNAASVGRYFNFVVRPGFYPYVRLN